MTKFGEQRLPRKSQGFALVIVLAALVLVLGIAIAFINRASTERVSSNAYSSSVTARLLADNVVNLVEAQVGYATTVTGTAQPVAWASQPGLIRTFKPDGSLLSTYKLYSDQDMVSSTLDLAAMTSALATWQTDTAHFTDLNAPVSTDLNGDGKVDDTELVYPILNPEGIGTSGGKSPYIDGFAISSAPQPTTRQPAPMPVRWLYVLRDGSLVAATGSGKTATVTAATTGNPIVGRVAFWTDDESCKLNINTAAHGSYWDIPRATSNTEGTYARFQPALREFQRYPGHPATTSLAPVMGYLFGTTPNGATPYANLTGANEAKFADFIYHIMPRVETGGSLLGTVMASTPVTLDTDRLYSAPDELIFQPERTVQSYDNVTLTKADLERMRFFLTAHSRAPELNLFHRPRISMWPINNGDNNKQPSSLDRLLKFCSTFDGIPFYLQRSEPDDPASDIGIAQNQALLSYLRSMMGQPFPGFGSTSFNDKYTQPESNQISLEMLDYIRASNIMSVTNYGGTPFCTDATGQNFTGSQILGTRAGQISPMIDKDTSSKGFGRIPTISKAILQFYISDIVQLNADGTDKVSLMTRDPLPLSKSDVNNSSTPRGAAAPLVQLPTDSSGKAAAGLPYDLYSQAILYFDFFDPMLGYPQTKYNFDLIVSFSGPWTVTTARGTVANLGFKSSRIPVRYNGFHSYDYNRTGGGNTRTSNSLSYGTVLGGGRTVMNLLSCFPDVSNTGLDNLDNSTGANGGDGLTDFYPLVSVPIKLHPTLSTIQVTESGSNAVQFAKPPVIATLGSAPQADGAAEFQKTFTFNGGTAQVQLVVRHGAPQKDEIIQEFKFDFPPFTKPLPAHAHSTASSLDATPTVNVQRKQMNLDMNFRNRITGAPARGLFVGQDASGVAYPNDKAQTFLVPYWDIAVSLEPAYGDPRLIAGKYSLTTDQNTSFVKGSRATGDFVPHEDYARLVADAKDIRERNAYSMRISPENASRYYYGSTKGANGYPTFGLLINGLKYGENSQPDVPSRYLSGVPTFNADGSTGQFPPDFDTGTSYNQDGAYINRADEGSIFTGNSTTWPWFQIGGYTEDVTEKPTFYSPNKQMPGAGMLGSLPTGVERGLPWQTLLFHPDPDAVHPGSKDPPDYLMLDLFWMPVVEPYAISERLSTAGKVNLNQQILPFSYISRETALRGLLLGEKLPAISNSDLVGSPPTDLYKNYLTTQPTDLSTRYTLDLSETLKAIDAKFADGGAYRSEAEFCTIPLIPQGQSYSSNFAYDSTWWKSRTATGDNLKERPYTDLLPRLTTKSNIYTIHYRVQSLAKRPGSDAKTWTEGVDNITGEYRGSTIVERFINPNLSEPAWTTASMVPNLDSYYRWRVVNQRQFAP